MRRKLQESEIVSILFSWAYKKCRQSHNADYAFDDFLQAQDSFAELIQGFQPQIDAYSERLETIREQAQDLYRRIVRALGQVDIDLNEYALPDPDLPEESDSTLYNSHRGYFEQLEYYKAMRAGDDLL